MLTDKIFQEIVYDILQKNEYTILNLAKKALNYEEEQTICLLECFPCPIEELLLIAKQYSVVDLNYGEIKFLVCLIPHQTIVDFFMNKKSYQQFVDWLNIKTKEGNVNFIYAGVKLLSGEIDTTGGAN